MSDTLSLPGLNTTALVTSIGKMETGSLGYPSTTAYSYVSPAGALGAYGFMPGTLAQVMPGVSPSQFLASPTLQDQAAATLATQYYNTYGNVPSVGQAWLGGPGSVGNASVTDPYTGISTGQYGANLSSLYNQNAGMPDTMGGSSTGSSGATQSPGSSGGAGGDVAPGTYPIDPNDPEQQAVEGGKGEFSQYGYGIGAGSAEGNSGIAAASEADPLGGGSLSSAGSASPSSDFSSQYQVAGVNAPITSGDSTAAAPSGQSLQVTPGTPLYITDPSQIGQNAANTISSATTQLGSDIQSSEGQAAAAGTSWVGSLESYVQGGFIRGGFILLGLVVLMGAFLFFYMERSGNDGSSVTVKV